MPINIAKRVVPSLIENGEYAYPWMGISGQTLRPQVAEAMSLDQTAAAARFGGNSQRPCGESRPARR